MNKRLQELEKFKLESEYSVSQVKYLEEDNKRLSEQNKELETKLREMWLLRFKNPYESTEETEKYLSIATKIDNLKQLNKKPSNVPFEIEIITDKEDSIIAASLEKMLNLFLELEGPSLEKHRKIFFCGYRSFVSPLELLFLFQELYCRVGGGFAQTDNWNKIIAQISFWSSKYTLDFTDEVSGYLVSFFETVVSKSVGEKVSKSFLDSFYLLKEKFSKSDPLKKETRKSLEPNRIISMFSDSSSCSNQTKLGDNSELLLFAASEISSSISLTKNINEKWTLLDLKPELLAEQLVLIEFELWKCLEEREFLNTSWNKKEKHLLAPNITCLISHFNYVSCWVVTQILSFKDLKERKNCIEYFIKMINHAKKLNSFNTIYEILSALNKSPIVRLKNTWSEISSKWISKFQDFDTLMVPSASHKNLRESVSKAKSDYFSFLSNKKRHKSTVIEHSRSSSDLPSSDPLLSSFGYLPYLGLYLQDLYFIEEGNKNKREDGLYNYAKIEFIHRVITNVFDAKSSQYESKKKIFRFSFSFY